MIGKRKTQRIEVNNELKHMQEWARIFRMNKDRFNIRKLAKNYYTFEVKIISFG